jgi:hypothetical protein
VERSEYTHEPVSNDQRFVVYSAEHLGHANARSALTPVPISKRLTLKFSSRLFSSTAADDDAGVRSRAGSSLMLIGANSDVELNSAHASARARNPNEA